MTHEQYSRFQRLLGILEGYGMALANSDVELFWDTIERLDALGDEIAPKTVEVQDGT